MIVRPAGIAGAIKIAAARVGRIELQIVEGD